MRANLAQMKFDISKVKTKKKSVKIKALRTPLNMERELENFNKFMVKTIAKRFENQVLKKLDKKTVAKFSDASVGNYAIIVERLFRAFIKGINLQFSEKRIRKYIKNLYARTNNLNDKTLYRNIEKVIGIDVKSIIKTDGLNTFANAKSLETSIQIIKLKKDTKSALTQNTLRLMSASKSLDTLYDEVKKTKFKHIKKSELVARNELKTFNQQLNDKRAKNLGVKKAIWKTVSDERTRPCHRARANKEFDIKKGLYSSCDGLTISPGSEVNCRCYSEYIVNFD